MADRVGPVDEDEGELPRSDYGVFAYAVKRGWLAANPATGTAPKQSRVKQSRPELRFLTELELAVCPGSCGRNT